MPRQRLPCCLYAGLGAISIASSALAEVAMSDWRTGVATNYGGLQDGRVRIHASSYSISFVGLPPVMRVLHIQCVKDACTDAPILFATMQDPYEPSFGTSIVSPSLTTQSASSVMQPAVSCASLTVGDCLGLLCTIALCVPLFALEP